MAKKNGSLKHSPCHHKDQQIPFDRYRKKGYAYVDNSRLGLVLAQIQEDGFVDQVVVSIQGRVQRYKPFLPNTLEALSLPRKRQKKPYVKKIQAA